ncbi:MAG: accessory factor UbiK family protein [Rhodospirillales bacterium]
MQTRSKIFDDLAKVAGGAASSFAGLKSEIDDMVRQQIERLLSGANIVPRDEFDAVKAVAAKARAEQEKLEKRVQALEKKLGVKAPSQPSGKTKAKKKPAKKPKI